MLMLISNNTSIMGRHTNGRAFNILGSLAVASDEPGGLGAHSLVWLRQVAASPGQQRELFDG